MTDKKSAQAASLAWVQQYWPLLQSGFYQTSAPFGYSHDHHDIKSTDEKQTWLAWQLYNLSLDYNLEIPSNHDERKTRSRKNTLDQATEKWVKLYLEKAENPARKNPQRDAFLESAPCSDILKKQIPLYTQTCKQSRRLHPAVIGLVIAAFCALFIFGFLSVAFASVALFATMGLSIVPAIIAIVLAIKRIQLGDIANNIAADLIQQASSTLQTEMLQSVVTAGNTQDSTADVDAVIPLVATMLSQLGGATTATENPSDDNAEPPVAPFSVPTSAHSRASSLSGETEKPHVVIPR